MISEHSNNFYLSLHGESSLTATLQSGLFEAAPKDWFLIVADIKDSTRAIEQDRYKDINMIGGSVIAIVKNAMQRQSFPYVFGGDGATLLVPSSQVDAVAGALANFSVHVEQNFSLHLRIGIVSVADLCQVGEQVLVAKQILSPKASMAALSGSGIKLATDLVKERATDVSVRVWRPRPDPRYPFDLTGLYCRWYPLPSNHGLIDSMIIEATATDLADRHRTFAKILRFIEDEFGRDKVRPISESRLRLLDRSTQMLGEAKLKVSSPQAWLHWLKSIKLELDTRLLRWMLRNKNRAVDGVTITEYFQDFIKHSDFCKIEGELKMTIDLGPEQHDQMVDFLESLRIAGEIHYGLHAATQSLVTCLVYDVNDHLHFIDADQGGYAVAAKNLIEARKKLAHLVPGDVHTTSPADLLELRKAS